MRTLRDFLIVLLNLVTALNALARRMDTMSTAMDNLTAAVANTATVETSAISLIQGLADRIKTTSDDPAVQALADELQGNANKLAAAITSGTPAATVTGTPPAAANTPTQTAEPVQDAPPTASGVSTGSGA